MSKAFLYSHISDQLTQIHPDVDHLVINTDENIDSWKAIANAFPNVTRIHIDKLAQVGGKRVIDSDFFREFPALTHFVTEPRKKINIDLTDVDANLLSQLTELRLNHCLAADLSVLGGLPKLKSLTVVPDTQSVRLHTQVTSGLNDIRLIPKHKNCVLDLDFSTSSLKELYILRYNNNSLNKRSPTTFDNLVLPTCLAILTIDIATNSILPPNLLSHITQLKYLSLEQEGGTITESLLGGITHIVTCNLRLKNIRSTVPATLFNNIISMSTLHLDFDNTVLEENFLPQDLPIEELILQSKKTDLTPLVNSTLPMLHNARIEWQHEQFPAWLAHSQQVTNLDLSFNGDISAMPTLPMLTTCILRHSHGDQLPAAIRHNTNINSLELLSCTFPALGDVHSMSALQNIRISTSYWGGEPTPLPDMTGIDTLPALTCVRLYVKTTKVDPTWLKLSSQVKLRFRDERLEAELNILRNSALPYALRLKWLNTLITIKKPAELPEMPAQFHLTMMAAKYNRFKAQHKTWLRQVATESEQQKPIDSNSVIFISGRSAFKAAELKAKSAELGFTLSKKLDAAVTHVLIGSAPKSLDLLDADCHLLIDETSLQHYFTAEAPKFLQQADTEAMSDSVINMLSSPDEASHQVAMEMLEQGGVTEAIRLPLFFILKTTSNNKLRKQAKHLLAGIGDDNFQLAINDRVLFHSCRGKNKYGRQIGQGVMVDKLKKQKKKWGEPLCTQFTELYFERFGEGLLYLMMQRKLSTEQLDVLATLVEGDCLNWRRGAAFEQALAQFDEQDMAYYYRRINCNFTVNYYWLLGKAKTYLPQELAQNHAIQELDLGHCLLAELPKGIEHYRHIRSLNLSCNALTELPKDFSRFCELEELSLSHNHFSAFPDVLLKLPKLKRLDIRRARKPVTFNDQDKTYTYQGGTSSEGPYQPIRAPQAFRDAFPDCEILEDAINKNYALISSS